MATPSDSLEFQRHTVAGSSTPHRVSPCHRLTQYRQDNPERWQFEGTCTSRQPQSRFPTRPSNNVATPRHVRRGGKLRSRVRHTTQRTRAVRRNAMAAGYMHAARLARGQRQRGRARRLVETHKATANRSPALFGLLQSISPFLAGACRPSAHRRKCNGLVR
jgi:hypothetical protein